MKRTQPYMGPWPSSKCLQEHFQDNGDTQPYFTWLMVRRPCDVYPVKQKTHEGSVETWQPFSNIWKTALWRHNQLDCVINSLKWYVKQITKQGCISFTCLFRMSKVKHTHLIFLLWRMHHVTPCAVLQITYHCSSFFVDKLSEQGCSLLGTHTVRISLMKCQCPMRLFFSPSKFLLFSEANISFLGFKASCFMALD